MPPLPPPHESSFLHIGASLACSQVLGVTLSLRFCLPGSVSVPSVTVVAVASWVRGICKYSVSHLSLKRSSATRTEEAQRARAAMAIRPLSQKCLERPPQDRERRQSKSAPLIANGSGSAGGRVEAVQDRKIHRAAKLGCLLRPLASNISLHLCSISVS